MATSCIAQHLEELAAATFRVTCYSKASCQLKPPNLNELAYDNVPPGKGYHRPKGAVMDEYGAMVRRQFAGENLRKLNEKVTPQ
jgi:hypothetical protein